MSISYSSRFELIVNINHPTIINSLIMVDRTLHVNIRVHNASVSELDFILLNKMNVIAKMFIICDFFCSTLLFVASSWIMNK